MGIDIQAGGRRKTTQKKNTNSANPYIKLLVKLYRFLVRRTSSKFNKAILRRLIQVRNLKMPMSLRKVTKLMQKKDGKIAVVVGAVTDDVRLLEVPKLSVCALKFTETARARILKAGGECLTFDQLVLRSPVGSGTVLLRASIKARTALRYMGKAPGTPNSTTRPRMGAGAKRRGRKFEMARGRRKSRGFRN